MINNILPDKDLQIRKTTFSAMGTDRIILSIKSFKQTIKLT
jgi:hypothetical protein